MGQVRVVILIQVLNSFVAGVLGVALPLMMKERNVDIITIGLVFASLPMIFQLGRILFATVSDFGGKKRARWRACLSGIIGKQVVAISARRGHL